MRLPAIACASSARLIAATTVLIVVAGCGGSSSTPQTTPPTSPPTSSTAPVGADPTSEITQAFVAFFSGRTPGARKITLVQDGTAFATVINAQAGTPIAAGTTAVVAKVRLLSDTEANVVYTVSLGGTPALKNQVGRAVKEGGAWKVSASTFCSLLMLEQTAPPICKTLS